MLIFRFLIYIVVVVLFVILALSIGGYIFSWFMRYKSEQVKKWHDDKEKETDNKIDAMYKKKKK